jgi:hypothetical protein
VDKNAASLKPCPFCGDPNPDPHFALHDDGRQTPGCMICGAEAPTVEVWNSRASPESQQLKPGPLHKWKD